MQEPIPSDAPAAAAPPARYFLQYTIPDLKSVDHRMQMHVEQSLRAHPTLCNLSILPEPVLVTEQTIEDQQREEYNRQLEERMKLPMRYFDPTQPDRAAEMMAVVKHRFEHNHGFQTELDLLATACNSTPDYAWAWASGLAMAIHDEGVDPARANRAAARFMRMLFKCDITKISHFAATQHTVVAKDEEYEPNVLVATNRESFYNSFFQYWNAVREGTGVAPTLAPFAEIDRGQIQFPIAYRFAPPAAPGLPIRIQYLAAGKAVQDGLDRMQAEGLSTEPTLPANVDDDHDTYAAAEMDMRPDDEDVPEPA